ncbi:MAG: hypothetical protein NZ899_15190 [Thermoguttaceae bacterium]|nr:hypothetical protein [Thermoguttaceae bacterium]
MSRSCLSTHVILIAAACHTITMAAEPIALGTRFELLVDDYLLDKIANVTWQLHRPNPKEVVLVTDEPWEGNTSGYYTIFQDGDRYRMYYRGLHYDEQQKRLTHREVTCYAESRDGIHWEKPRLGLFEFNGSTNNNIVWDGPGTHNFTPFKDLNPTCPPEAKYKALGSGPDSRLLAFQSPDGIHWSLMQEKPVITEGAFDSQNLAFWDSNAQCYRAYWRIFKNGVRDIRTATSKDFVHWEPWQDLDYQGAPPEHLYTNAILPYERAPHILLGFPTRFLPQTQQVEPTFMVSRDGVRWRRWLEAIIPLDAPQDRAGNRSNYMAWGMVRLPHNPAEYSMYATEAYYTGPASRLRRFTYRVDGFVSLRAETSVGEFTTKPLTFSGNKLVFNFLTKPDGWLAVEIQDSTGKPIAPFTLDNCDQLKGDSIGHVVTWRTNGDLSSLAGVPVRLRVMMKNADLFSLQFRSQ